MTEQVTMAREDYEDILITAMRERDRIRNGINALIAQCEKSPLREPVGGHQVVTVDYLTGRLHALLDALGNA